MNASTLIKSSSLYLVGNVANRLVGFLMIPLYTRFLAPSEYATIELVDLSIGLIVITLGYSALSQSMIRIYYEWDEFQDRAAVVSSALLVLAVLGLAVTLAGMGAAEPISRCLFRSAANASFVRVCFLATYLGNLIEVCLAYERIQDRALLFVTYSILQLLVTVALNVYFLVFGHLGIWCFALSRLIVTVAGASVLLPAVLREVRLRWRLEAVRRMASFGAPLILSAVCFFVIHFSDRFFLNRYATLTELGIYSLAYKFGFLITFLVGQPFGRAWNVSLYKYVTHDGWKEDFARVARYLFFFIFVAAVAIILYADKVLGIMASSAFRPAAAIVPIVISAYVFRECGDFFKNLLFIVKARSRRVGAMTVVCALLNLGLNAVLIPPFGIKGAAWATLFTWLTYLSLMWLAAHVEFHIPYHVSSFAVLTGAAVLMLYAGRPVAALPSIWQWGLDTLLLGGFVVLVVSLGYFPQKEWETLSRRAARALCAFSQMVCAIPRSAGREAPPPPARCVPTPEWLAETSDSDLSQTDRNAGPTVRT